MKLYYTSGACSLASRIVLEETGITYQSEKVDLKTRKTEGGKDFKTINLKGYVPALELDNKEILTEGAVIMQYLADQVPAKNLIPKSGTIERYRCQEWLNFVATEIHGNFRPLVKPGFSDDAKAHAKKELATRFDYLAERINGKTFLMGAQFTVADAYLFTVVRWSESVGMDLTKWPKIMGYFETIQNRPAVQNALKHDGIKSQKSA
ncbi:MAG: glutathione transferase GstA [Bdellovibrionota bacterium]